MAVLLVDHHDSYTHNLAHLLARVTGAWPVIRQADAISLEDVRALEPEAIVLSPGPGRPDVPRDAGVSVAIVRALTETPILGVCLGHQIIAHAHGATVERARHPLHGRTSPITHSESRLLAGLPQGFRAMRYHSLSVMGPLPPPLVATAHSDDGEIMALEHTSRALFGVQFHPESIATEAGLAIIARFCELAHVRRTPQAQRRGQAEVGHGVVASVEVPFVDPPRAFEAMFASAPHAFLLHDARDGGAWSYAGAGTLRERPALDAAVTRPARDALAAAIPFCGGLVGYVDYEQSAPQFLHTNETLAFDHRRRRALACATAEDASAARARAEEIAAEYAKKIAEPARAAEAARSEAGKSHGSFRHDRAAYEELVRRCIELIARGEAYELCLTNRFEGETSFDPWTLYRRLTAASPSHYAAFLRIGSRALLSSSPERLLTLHDGVAETRPIKGTRPRGRDPADDDAQKAALVMSEKDRAENLMIVDVSRHDLGGVSVASGVSVPALLEVEAHPTVFQLVSTVRAEIDPTTPASAVLGAVLPPASMTGAPKQRAIEHLRALEGVPRGAYSGALGYLDASGAMDFSVIIRTLVVDGPRVSFGVGGAVLLDSDPAAEWEETQVKARALLLALGVSR